MQAIANRNFLIHQCDIINRRITWVTLSRDLAAWQSAFGSYFAAAKSVIDSGD